MNASIDMTVFWGRVWIFDWEYLNADQTKR